MNAKTVATVVVVLATVATVAARQTARPARRARGDAVRAAVAHDVAEFDRSLVALSGALRTRPADSSDTRIRLAFATARTGYKRLEGVVEAYTPSLASAINSRRQETDDDDAPPPSSLAPSGFPVLEQLLWPRLDPRNADSAARIVDGMRPLAVRLRTMLPELVPTSAQITEIARLELARISTLGIAGFDAPRTGRAMVESADALDGLRDLLTTAEPSFWTRQQTELQASDAALARASAYLRANPDFGSFNRLAFIVDYAEPAAQALDALRRAAGTTSISIQRGWRSDAASVYDRDAFDPRVNGSSTAPPPVPELIALGARLFFDPSLSGPRTRSCASCHRPDLAFTDGLATPRNIDPRGKPVARNTPTLLNAALQPAQFADERAASLEDQVLVVLSSPSEMASSAELAATRLSRDQGYRASFARVFGGTPTDTVTPLRVRQALAAYVRSLIALDSRFDRAVRGDTLAINDEERRGFTLFMGKAACGTCHFAPLFSGNTPPRYLSSDVEVIGTTSSPLPHASLDADSGRARIDGLPIHLRAFKTPSLRNVTLTAPYMHNGAFRTLDDVLRFYDRGGGVGSGAIVPNQTLPADSLSLSTAERRAIIAFLGALVDTATIPRR